MESFREDLVDLSWPQHPHSSTDIDKQESISLQLHCAINMRFLIFGANGRTGSLATAEALKRGHTVTALVRSSFSMQPHEGLTIVEGTPHNQSDVERAFASTPEYPIHAVLVLLNAPRKSDSPFSKPKADTPRTLVQDCVRNATAVMKKHGVERIVVMSAFGIGSSFKQLPFLMKMVFEHTNMKFQMKDHEATDGDITQADGLQWTLVRPAMLKEGDALPVKEFGDAGNGIGMFDSITRASVAQFMVRVAEGSELIRKAMVIGN